MNDVLLLWKMCKGPHILPLHYPKPIESPSTKADMTQPASTHHTHIRSYPMISSLSSLQCSKNRQSQWMENLALMEEVKPFCIKTSELQAFFSLKTV